MYRFAHTVVLGAVPILKHLSLAVVLWLVASCNAFAQPVSPTLICMSTSLAQSISDYLAAAHAMQMQMLDAAAAPQIQAQMVKEAIARHDAELKAAAPKPAELPSKPDANNVSPAEPAKP